MLTNQMQALPQRYRVQRFGPFSIYILFPRDSNLDLAVLYSHDYLQCATCKYISLETTVYLHVCTYMVVIFILPTREVTCFYI